jgi:hypothetical protein
MIVSIGDSFNKSINEDSLQPATVSKRKKKWVMPDDNYWDGISEKPVINIISKACCFFIGNHLSGIWA